MQARSLAYDDVVPDDSFLAALRAARDRRRQRDSNRLYQCVVLARDLETCEALLRGDRVPHDRLDPEWARRLGVF